MDDLFNLSNEASYTNNDSMIKKMDTNYLFVYDYESDEYEFNPKCEIDFKDMEFTLAKTSCELIDEIPNKINAIDYLRHVINKINLEIQTTSNVPCNLILVYCLLFLAAVVAFFIILYFFILVTVLFLFSPIILVLEFFLLRRYMLFILSLKMKINENLKKTKILNIINYERGKYIYKDKLLGWTYGRDGSWIEFKYLKINK